MNKTIKEKYIGNKIFYKTIFIIMIPILLQSAITNFVNMLDNIMIGQVGTLEMSAVSIVNQLIFIFNLVIFGSLSGAGIYGAQFYGNGNYDGMRECFRFKLIIGFIISLLGIFILYFFATPLTSLYMNPNTNTNETIVVTLAYASSYIKYIVIGLLPFAISQCISTTIRESGETFLPMASSLIAIFINLIFNYLLIFGNFGFPKLGTDGAAIATTLSRFVELLFLIIASHRIKEKLPFFKEIFPLKVSTPLTKKILAKGTPLALNEFFWSFGIAAINQCYSTRGLVVVAADNIAATIFGLFIIFSVAMGQTMSILIGQKLGANEFDEAVDNNRKITFLSFSLCVILGLIMVGISSFFPRLYNVTEEVKHLAAIMIIIDGILLPTSALYNCAYYTLRSGGKVFITSLFDSGLTCFVAFPLAFILSRYTNLPLITMYIIIRSLDILKAVIGTVLVNKKIWINRLV